MTIKSCHNCKNCHSWHFSATREDPEDSGWECKLELDIGDVDDTLSETELGIYFAEHCPSYEFQPELPEPPDEFINPDPDMKLLSDTVRLQDMGLLDENFMPTDAFFAWV